MHGPGGRQRRVARRAAAPSPFVPAIPYPRCLMQVIIGYWCERACVAHLDELLRVEARLARRAL